MIAASFTPEGVTLTFPSNFGIFFAIHFLNSNLCFIFGQYSVFLMKSLHFTEIKSNGN